MPSSAYGENWLYELIDRALDIEFDRVDASLPPSGFLEHVPPDRVAVLARKRELRSAVDDVVAAYIGLGAAERGVVRQAQREQRDIQALFDGAGIAMVRSQLPSPVGAHLALLADRAFEALETLRIRERSYKIHARRNPLFCAFCGYEAWDQPSVRTMDWDHYLPRSLYPFAAMNLRNLAPMGTDCNRYYKSSKDILRSGGGTRRVCFDPYASCPPTIDLSRSELFAGAGGSNLWVISYHGDQDRCASWDAVFELDSRWKGQLDRMSDACLEELACHFGKTERPTQAMIIERLKGCHRRFTNPRRHSFLMGAIFELWLRHLQASSPAAGRLLRKIQRTIARCGRRPEPHRLY